MNIIKAHNTFVIEFLKEQSEELVELWESKEVQDAFIAATPKAKVKKQRKKKDPNAPKGARNAYIFFCKDERTAVKEEFPEMKSTEIVSELGRRWQIVKSDEPDTLEHYNQLAAEDKARFKDEIKVYTSSEEEKKSDIENEESEKSEEEIVKKPQSGQYHHVQVGEKCGCGTMVKTEAMLERHLKTKKHAKWLESQ